MCPDLSRFTSLIPESSPPFSAPGWISELKYDVYRLPARPFRRAVTHPQGTDATGWFPQIVAAIAQLPSEDFVLDRKVCVCGPGGPTGLRAAGAGLRSKPPGNHAERFRYLRRRWQGGVRQQTTHTGRSKNPKWNGNYPSHCCNSAAAISHGQRLLAIAPGRLGHSCRKVRR